MEAIIEKGGLKRYTPNTITSLPRLKKRLQEVRESGYTIADAEYKPDLCVIAAPIRDHHGRASAALMTALQSERARRNKSLVGRIIELLKREAAVISRELGWIDPHALTPPGGNGRKP